MIIYAVNHGYTRQDDYYTDHGATLAFATGTRTEPTGHTNASLSAVAFAPSDLDVSSKNAAAEKGRTEKLSLKLSSSSSLGVEQV